MVHILSNAFVINFFAASQRRKRRLCGDILERRWQSDEHESNVIVVVSMVSICAFCGE